MKCRVEQCISGTFHCQANAKRSCTLLSCQLPSFGVFLYFFMGYHCLVTAKSPGSPNELLRNLCFPPLAIFLRGISGQMRWPPFRDALR